MVVKTSCRNHENQSLLSYYLPCWTVYRQEYLIVVIFRSTISIPLLLCREQWVALGPPVEVMAFDFYEAEANMQPVSVPVAAAITADGMCSAVAFWFDLQLDENSQLSSSPYCNKVYQTHQC